MWNLDRLDSRILDDLPARSLPVHFLLRTKLGVERCCSHHRLLLRNLRILVGSIHWLLLMQLEMLTLGSAKESEVWL